MPKDVFLQLMTDGKTRNGHKASIETSWFLEQSGWTVLKKTRNYCYLKPPPGHRPGKLNIVKVPVPTDDEILDAANEMHAATVVSSRMLHGWPAKYSPAHDISIRITDVDPFTGVQGKSETARTTDSAVFCIGFISIWQAEVRWYEDGKPILTKYPKCEVQGPESRLFDSVLFSPLDQAPQQFKTITYTEGTPQSVLVDIYERNSLARKACIEHYGAQCQVCGFDFGKTYGKIGEGFIHVHHVRPLSEVGEQYQVHPVVDLRPVCPNCHAMLHRKDPPLLINQLKSRMGNKLEESVGDI
jgi:HNH endonuclease